MTPTHLPYYFNIATIKHVILIKQHLILIPNSVNSQDLKTCILPISFFCY